MLNCHFMETKLYSSSLKHLPCITLNILQEEDSTTANVFDPSLLIGITVNMKHNSLYYENRHQLNTIGNEEENGMDAAGTR